MYIYIKQAGRTKYIYIYIYIYIYLVLKYYFLNKIDTFNTQYWVISMKNKIYVAHTLMIVSFWYIKPTTPFGKEKRITYAK